MLQSRNLYYSYKEKPVLEDINFDLIPGEILGIIGPNGCGKTTLLGNLNKNLSPKGGCVMIHDTDLEDLKKKEIAREIAVIPQTNEIKFSFTVKEIVSMGRMPFQEAFQGESYDDIAIIEDAIEKAGIADMTERYINTMSGGERQKVIIARALAQTPNVLLMDEPTLHLDISAQFDILDLIQSLSREEGLTVVIVSHDLSMAARYCDRVMMIYDHKNHAIGNTEDVLTPENMRTVFNVEAELTKDSRTWKNMVLLYGSATGKRS